MDTKKTNQMKSKNFSDFLYSKPMCIAGTTLKWIGRTVGTLLLVAAMTASMVGCNIATYVVDTFGESQDIPDLSRIMDNGTSIIYTQNDEGEWKESQRIEGINRIWKDLNEIPDPLQKALIAIEDERFYKHHGVDWKRTAAAVVEQVFGDGSFGGSTITQQLIKVVTGDNESTIERKIREIFRALEMERDHYTKDEILEAYLNILPLSDGVVGVGAAANYYFAKDVENLSIAECALIAGVTNLPGYYDPYDHPDHAKKRQETILDKMHELGFITEDEYIQAYNEELVFKSSAITVEIQDYYVDTLIEDIIRDLMDQHGYNYTYAEQLVYFGGLRIYSYENIEKQAAVEAVMADDSNFIDIEEEDENPNAAVFIMDYEGRVVAVGGGRGEKTGNRVQNNATQSQRQPGSTMKPLGVFAPAIDRDLVNYSTIVRDAPITLPDGTDWPPNYGYTDAFDNGWMTVQYALQESKNTVPVRILDEMGFEASYSFLKDTLHFTSLDENDYAYAPLALGGMTYGVTVREMCQGYQIFGNGGVFNKPYTYNRVETDDGEVLLEHVPENEQAISPDTATIMNKLLQTVTSRGTGIEVHEVTDRWRSTQLFSKSGTTDNNKDAYFAGGSPYYVAALWMGYDSNQISLSYNQRMSSKYLFSKCMEAVHQGMDHASFDEWGDVEGHYYDPEKGVVTDESTNKNDKPNLYGYYKSDNVPYGDNHFGDIAYEPTTTTTEETTTTKAKKTTKTKKTTTTTEAEEETTTTTETVPTEETTTTDPMGEGGETTSPEGDGGESTEPVETTTTTTMLTGVLFPTTTLPDTEEASVP